MNQERPKEVDARRIVERVMGIELEHADTNGGVDYLSSDGTIAVEVTAVTDGAKKSAREALLKSETKDLTVAELQECWTVMIPDDQPGMKTFLKRVQRAITELESLGRTHFERQDAMVHVIENGDLSHVYLPLLKAGVERADHLAHQYQPDHIHRIYPVPGSGGSASGSDEALARLVEELDEKTDNPAKLRESGAEQRHLFVWLDDDTSYSIARPLSREAPAWRDEGWGVPTAGPQLDPAITHLWVLHARSRLGWLWDGCTWQELQEP